MKFMPLRFKEDAHSCQVLLESMNGRPTSITHPGVNWHVRHCP